MKQKKNLSLFSIINFLHHAKIHRRREREKRKIVPEHRPHFPPTPRHDENVYSGVAKTKKESENNKRQTHIIYCLNFNRIPSTHEPPRCAQKRATNKIFFINSISLTKRLHPPSTEKICFAEKSHLINTKLEKLLSSWRSHIFRLHASRSFITRAMPERYIDDDAPLHP